MQHRPAPAYLLALVAVEADEPGLEVLATEVARDVTHDETPAHTEREAARAALDWLLGSLRGGSVPDDVMLRALRLDAAAAARAGRPLQPVLDRALSAGWALWDRIAAGPALSAEGLRSLGDALLRTGDAAAAAIAEGHATAEREIAARSASSLRELLDAMLGLEDGDDAARGRLLRRAGELGIPVDRPVTVAVADAGRDLQDGDPAVIEVARRVAPGVAPSVGDPRALAGPRPVPVVASSAGRLVVLVPEGRRTVDVPAAFASLGGWTATSAEATGVLGVAGAFREATAALAVARRAGRRGSVVPAASLALERALLAEPALLRDAVHRELGPLIDSPRSGGLVDTVETFLAERENVRATARRLGIAPRTVAYRLERVERLLGGPLDAERRLRLATALFARGLLGDRAADAAALGSGPPRRRPTAADPDARVRPPPSEGSRVGAGRRR